MWDVGCRPFVFALLSTMRKWEHSEKYRTGIRAENERVLWEQTSSQSFQEKDTHTVAGIEKESNVWVLCGYWTLRKPRDFFRVKTFDFFFFLFMDFLLAIRCLVSLVRLAAHLDERDEWVCAAPGRCCYYFSLLISSAMSVYGRLVWFLM